MASVNKTESVTIQGHVIPVVPQKHARLRRKLSADDFARIMSGNYAAESYRVLGILIPALPEAIPAYEWEGYTSQEAMDSDQYDEDNDPSPTTAEIVDAFETALMVSGAGRLGKIIDLVQMGVEAQAMETQAETPTLPASPGESGE